MNENDELDDDDHQYDLYPDDDQMVEEHEQDMSERHADVDYPPRKIRETHDTENSTQQESSSRKRRKLSPIVYTRSRSNSPSSKPTLASTVSSVLRKFDKQTLLLQNKLNEMFLRILSPNNVIYYF